MRSPESMTKTHQEWQRAYQGEKEGLIATHKEQQRKYQREKEGLIATHEEQQRKYQREKEGLIATHEEQLTEERKRLEADKAVLQNALLTTVDRFEPMPDRELKQQLSVLKNRVATLARSP